ncbi:hypothetical protein PG991_013049 [Apiospora marii]|uniref:Uncharacterized protein n=1 Tax=Apiospora marii TaxID=335849 RepID=A0ABR1RBS2_9PEZI
MEATGLDWSLQRLDGVWNAFLDAHDAGTDGLYISTWMAMWIFSAFAHGTKSQDRVLGAYEEAQLPVGPRRAEPKFHVRVFAQAAQQSGLYLYPGPR